MKYMIDIPFNFDDTPWIIDSFNEDVKQVEITGFKTRINKDSILYIEYYYIEKEQNNKISIENIISSDNLYSTKKEAENMLKKIIAKTHDCFY